ncbi:MAG: pseudouridine synthase [Pseudomonadales bacterium]
MKKPRPDSADIVPQTEKLQKVLAEQGLGGRREMERWITSGRVQVNGVVAHLGQRVSAGDRLRVDGRDIYHSQAPVNRVLLYNKPMGEVCSRKDPEGRPTVFDRLPDPGRGRWISIGRLDFNSSGLLLLTNDGDLANRMMHPSTGLDREYAVRVNGKLSNAQIAVLKAGIVDEGETLAFSDIEYYAGSGTNHWYHVTLREGRNREVRRLFESLEFMVSRLKRVRFGPVILPARIVRGRWEEMSGADLESLYRMLGLGLPAAHSRRVDERAGRRKSVLIPYPEIPAG